MKLKIKTLLRLKLFFNLVAIFAFAGGSALAQPNKKTVSKIKPPQSGISQIRIAVDQRIELLGIIFRLAGDQTLNQNKFKKYTDEIDAHFVKFREHPAVLFARRIREQRDICCDAAMSMAVHLTDSPNLKARRAFKDSALEKRWHPDEARVFAKLARQFAKDAAFRSFVRKHRQIYRLAETQMRKLVNEQVDDDWFTQFFGKRPKSRFVLAIGLQTGQWNFGTSFRSPNGSEELYAIIGAGVMDKEGSPQFDQRIIGTIIHEFNHSFVNPIVARYENELGDAGNKIYAKVANQMRKQGYTNWKTMIDESLVRASVARYILAHQGAEVAEEEVRRQETNGFLWTNDLYLMLGDYEKNRNVYLTFEMFLPKVVSYFVNLAPRINTKIEQFDARRPHLVSMIPANQSTNVSPEVTEIKLVFDKPMKKTSQALISVAGKEGQFPQVEGKFWSFDETGTIFTMKVKLQPDRTYDFFLNSETVLGFQSSEGIALKPVRIQFKTDSTH